ncbi:MAG: hypothetical protein QS98_C0005G0076 [archaeon GW2011_AR3]|nr:MAG: hypothetical protein QS98_C0005G0076 [archaeon GW2011_AR3]MBS3109419.1 hypothetical protein [Candidatus Woesearchaeota archaeon]
MEEMPIQGAGSMDVSKKTVVILLVITIVVSVLGVWTVLDRADYAQSTRVPVVQGQVSLNILPSEPASAQEATASSP